MKIAILSASLGLLVGILIALTHFDARTRPLDISENAPVPATFPVVFMEITSSSSVRHCRVALYEDWKQDAGQRFLISPEDQARCAADIRSQAAKSRKISSPNTTGRTLIAASVEFGSVAAGKAQMVKVFATWDDDLVNRGEYLATDLTFRPTAYTRYDAATILFTSVATGVATAGVASVLFGFLFRRLARVRGAALVDR
jgi:hypothetical protein